MAVKKCKRNWVLMGLKSNLNWIYWCRCCGTLRIHGKVKRYLVPKP